MLSPIAIRRHASIDEKSGKQEISERTDIQSRFRHDFNREEMRGCRIGRNVGRGKGGEKEKQ